MVDLRTRRTLAAVDRSMYTLMTQHPFAAINVTMICQAAAITRSTYYQYYLDKNDWLERACGQFMLRIDALRPALDDLRPLVAVLAPDAKAVQILLTVHDAAGDLRQQLFDWFAARIGRGYSAQVYAALATTTLAWQLAHPDDNQAAQDFAHLVAQIPQGFGKKDGQDQ